MTEVSSNESAELGGDNTGIPLSAHKEAFARNAIGIVAATAGLDVSLAGRDLAAVDLTLVSDRDYAPNALHPKLDVQSKCTERLDVQRAESIAWQLDRRSAVILSAPNRHSMAILCITVVSGPPATWLEVNDAGIYGNFATFYLQGQHLPPVPSHQNSIVVHIPDVTC